MPLSGGNGGEGTRPPAQHALGAAEARREGAPPPLQSVESLPPPPRAVVQSRADRDRIRQMAGADRKLGKAARRILKEYRDGRAASACLADLERAAR